MAAVPFAAGGALINRICCDRCILPAPGTLLNFERVELLPPAWQLAVLLQPLALGILAARVMAARQGHRKWAPSRSPLAAILLWPLLLLAIVVIKQLAPEGTHQPLPVQQLLHAAGDFNSPLAGHADAVHTAAPSAARRLRVLMLGHDLTVTGAPQALLEIARHLRQKGHSIRWGRLLR